jgi:hypothetical protein
MGGALSVALLTKATAYIFAGPLLAGIALGRRSALRLRDLRAVAVIAILVLAFNLPHCIRCLEYSGFVLGIKSVYADGSYRFGNDYSGLSVTVSNLIRNVGLHFSYLPYVPSAVGRIHRVLGMQTNDPASTWPGTQFERLPGYCVIKETCAPSPLHTLIVITSLASLCWMLVRQRSLASEAWYCAGVAGMFILFCALLRWQPWHVRMHTVMFILGAAPIGMCAVRLIPSRFQAVLAAVLLVQAQPFVYLNYDHPLIGRESVLRRGRESQYFADARGSEGKYRDAIELVRQSGCRDIGIDNSYNATAPGYRKPPLEYALMALLHRGGRPVRFIHVNVQDPSVKYQNRFPFQEPCEVVCLNCAGDAAKIERLKEYGQPIFFGQIAVYLQNSKVFGAASRP